MVVVLIINNTWPLVPLHTCNYTSVFIIPHPQSRLKKYTLLDLLLLSDVFRYEHANDDDTSLKSDPEGEKIHTGLLKKLNELESDLTFKIGKNCFSKSL